MTNSVKRRRAVAKIALVFGGALGQVKPVVLGAKPVKLGRG